MTLTGISPVHLQLQTWSIILQSITIICFQNIVHSNFQVSQSSPRKKNKYWRHSVLKQPKLLSQVQIIHMQDKTYTELNNIHIKNTTEFNVPRSYFDFPNSHTGSSQRHPIMALPVAAILIFKSTKIYLNQSPIFVSIFRRKSPVYPRSPWTLDDNSEFLCPSRKIESNATQFPRWPSYTATMAAIFKQQPSNDIRRICRRSFDIKFC